MADNEHELPITASRGESENSLVGSAAQAFFTPPMSSGVPGWISGYVILPPKAIKDAEGVGTCAQVSRIISRRYIVRFKFKIEYAICNICAILRADLLCIRMPSKGTRSGNCSTQR